MMAAFILNVGRRAGGRVSGTMMMSARQEHAAFEVFEPCLKLDASASRLPVRSNVNVHGRHWPLLGENPSAEIVSATLCQVS